MATKKYPRVMYKKTENGKKVFRNVKHTIAYDCETVSNGAEQERLEKDGYIDDFSLALFPKEKTESELIPRPEATGQKRKEPEVEPEPEPEPEPEVEPEVEPDELIKAGF